MLKNTPNWVGPPPPQRTGSGRTENKFCLPCLESGKAGRPKIECSPDHPFLLPHLGLLLCCVGCFLPSRDSNALSRRGRSRAKQRPPHLCYRMTTTLRIRISALLPAGLFWVTTEARLMDSALNFSIRFGPMHAVVLLQTDERTFLLRNPSQSAVENDFNSSSPSSAG
ncbi:hypothetical protein CDAR_284261 [Caerostris darwini]|uniref:Uncharacterized protein n=1 Tax=Caerostris darwini TaxID=1538125 RepID=A0AAV4VJF2_9ARAC|nr:hypothetical protein CDAR_284261 [Caerostris darwini]